MTNKKQLLTAITLATILIAGGFGMAPEAFSTGSGGNDDKKDNDKKDKKGGEDSNKFKDWKKENDKHDDDDDDKKHKVKVCHIPPGNEGNAHTIEISKSALDAHLGHGDTLGACPNDHEDDEDEPANIIFIRAITDDNGKTFNIDDFTISINGVVQDLGLPIPIEPNTEKTITGSVPEGYKFVLISGDPSCPVNIDSDTFSLKKGQTIVCTIYYDDLFVPGGATGPNPTITIVNNVAVDPEDGAFDITVSPIVGDPPVVGVTTIYTVGSHTTVTISGSDDRPILITGDGNCPENVGGFVNIESGQNITCIFSDRPTSVPGVLFNPTHVEIVLVGTEGEDCPDPTGTTSPCVIADGSFIIITDSELTDADDPTKLIVVYSIIQSPIPEELSPPQCTLEGLQDDGSGNIGFVLSCPNALDGNYAINYALINTV